MSNCRCFPKPNYLLFSNSVRVLRSIEIELRIYTTIVYIQIRYFVKLFLKFILSIFTNMLSWMRSVDRLLVEFAVKIIYGQQKNVRTRKEKNCGYKKVILYSKRRRRIRLTMDWTPGTGEVPREAALQAEGGAAQLTWPAHSAEHAPGIAAIRPQRGR
jgi:hypothetical protein